MARTTDAVTILRKLIEDDATLAKQVEQELVNGRVAELIYKYRTEAGLTQQQLAELIGTKQPVISRLEDADYEGSSIAMLVRIAGALNMRLFIDFVPAGKARTKRPPKAGRPQPV